MKKQALNPYLPSWEYIPDGELYLYTGFCRAGDRTRTGAMATVLEADMLTVRQAILLTGEREMQACDPLHFLKSMDRRDGWLL